MAKSVLLLTLALFATTAFATTTGCYSYSGDVAAVYEIESLYNSSNYVDVTDQGDFIYNFCNGVNGLNTSCKITSSSSAVIKNSETGACVKLTNGTIPKFYVQDASNPLGGIYLTYQQGDLVAGTTNVTYNYTVVLSCVEGGAYKLLSLNQSGSNQENYAAYASGKQGCPVFAFYQLANFVTKYKVIFIIAGIVIGVFVGLFGLRLFKPTLFLTAFVVVFLLMAFILFTFALGTTPTAAQQWGCLVGALILGILAGILLVKLEKVGVFFLGAWLGTSGSFLLYTLILNHFNAGKVVLIIFTVVAALISGVVALFIFEHVIIISTALGGAYITIRGVSLFAPAKYAYPNEIEIAREIQYNGFSKIPGIFYAYFSLIVILAVLGGFVQYRHKRSRDEEKSEHQVDYKVISDAFP